MTINIISDLHCRNKAFPMSFDMSKIKTADVLVMAGDMGTFVNYDTMLEKTHMAVGDRIPCIISIRGNHDYYVTNEHWLKHHGIPRGPSIMDNEVVCHTVDDESVDFICSPMWSPIKNNDLIREMMNDYNFIPEFTPEKCTELFWDNIEFLEASVKNSREIKHKVVIVTHHLPIRELIDERFQGSDINEAFCVIDDEAEKRLKALKPDLWIHGHSHNFLDTTIDGVRYVRNPYGYEWIQHSYEGRGGPEAKEHTGFVKDFIVEI